MVIAPRYARVGELHIDQKIEKKSIKRLRTYHEKRYTMGDFFNLICCPHWIERKQQKHFPLQKINWDQNSDLYRIVHDQNILRIYIHKNELIWLIKWWVHSKLLKSIWHHLNCNFNQRGAYTIHDVTKTNCQKYPSTLILKHVNFLAELINSFGVHLFNMTMYHKFTVLKYMCA